MRWLLAISLLVNALLIGAALLQRQPAAVKQPELMVEKSDFRIGPQLFSSKGSSDNNRLTWNGIVSGDLHEFVNRLREWGCPETIVQNLVVAEINRRFK